MEHTQGPWWANSGGEVGTVPDMRVKICSRVSGANPDEARANARLIAAAPQLLQALERLCDACNTELFVDGCLNCFANKAIKAAKGE